MQRRGLRAAIGHRDADQNIVGRGLGIFGEHIEVTLFIEHAGVGEFKLRLVASGAKGTSSAEA